MSILAYIDPGSGSLLLQALLAALLSVPFFFRRTIGDVWHRLRHVKSDDTIPDAPERPDR
ncbi:MAG TPA: hypothetical protein VEW45_00935 [Candidatus Dormibacteraeota bacterium]|nr:hypothetical protein [Candidatus Dormibacteraeota bacterium]